MKNNRNSYNNTAANRKNAFFAKKLAATLAALCAIMALTGATGSVPCRAANRTALFERSTVVQGAVVQAEQSRQQRSELRAAAAQKCVTFTEPVPSNGAVGSTSPAPSDTAPGGSSFRLQWYHYAIAAGAILIMTIITFAGVKPAGKKQ